jgi:hypothetical protein
MNTGSSLNNTGTSTGVGTSGTIGTGTDTTGVNANVGTTTGATGVNQVPDLSSLDINNDGQISRNEFTANNRLTASLFNRIDTNNDGDISQAELDAYKNANGAASGTGTSTTGAGTSTTTP